MQKEFYSGNWESENLQYGMQEGKAAQIVSALVQKA